jgi:hypothetical protein
MGKYAHVHLMGKRTGKAIHYGLNHTFTVDFLKNHSHVTVKDIKQFRIGIQSSIVWMVAAEVCVHLDSEQKLMDIGWLIAGDNIDFAKTESRIGMSLSLKK